MVKEEEAFTKVPNIILDDTTLDVYEKAILVHIARQTIGYRKKSDGISLSQFVKATGMGVSKVKTTIKILKTKKLIILKQQTAKNGGKSYNRYSLPLSHHTTNHSHDTANPWSPHDQPLSHDMAIQKKIEQKKIDKRRETETNVIFSFSENERKREVDQFIADISMDARNPRAYKVKIKKQVDKQNKETLEEFESWYLEKECRELTMQYVGQIDGYEIESIYSYSDTDKYDSDMKFLVQSIDADGNREIRAYSSKYILEADMQNELHMGEIVG